MSNSQFFVPNGEVYGVVLALTPENDRGNVWYLPQSLEPNTIEYYESLSSDQLIATVDDFVTVFPTIEGAQALMTLMYSSLMGNWPINITTALLEDILDTFDGEFRTKDELKMRPDDGIPF